jgi:hypothetical protein
VDITIGAALTYTIATVGVVAFQIALALGAPWGTYAMGGSFPGRFPPGLRVSAVLQAVVLGFIAVVVLSTAGLVVPSLVEGMPWLAWVPVVVSAVSLVVNAVSPSPGERRLWVPVAIVTLATSLLVVLTAD